MDDSSNDRKSGARIILISPEGHKFHSGVKFEFTTSNNEAEYEALLAGLWLVRSVQARAVEVFSDSLLMVNQILGEYQVRGFKMMAYLSKVKDSLAQFVRYSIQQVPREKNSSADALAKLASTKEMHHTC